MIFFGAEEGTRTPTPLRVRGPEPRASANSATSARYTCSAMFAEHGSNLESRKCGTWCQIAEAYRNAIALSRNTVHLIILMALQMSILGRGLTWRGRSGKLLILRLTPRGLRRLRLDTTRS